MINQILDFSKIEAGKLELEKTNFQVRSILEETLEIVTPKAAEKGLELALDMPPGMTIGVCGDANRLRQVVVNLLGNAIKFTHQGQVRGAGERVERNGRADRALRGGQRHRRGHSGRSAAPIVPLVFAGRCLDDARVRRYRAGTGNLASNWSS